MKIFFQKCNCAITIYVLLYRRGEEEGIILFIIIICFFFFFSPIGYECLRERGNVEKQNKLQQVIVKLQFHYVLLFFSITYFIKKCIHVYDSCELQL